MVLGVRNNTPNDIIQIEANCMPLLAKVQKVQKTFWIKLKEDISANPDSPLARLVHMGGTADLPFMKYYDGLLDSPHNTIIDFGMAAICAAKARVREEGEKDSLGKYGQYIEINPTLEHCDMYKLPIMTEPDRMILTRYRCGSHKLNIETGRWVKTPREDRLCKCKREPQTVGHLIYRCPNTMSLRPDVNIDSYIKTVDCAKLLRKLEAFI